MLGVSCFSETLLKAVEDEFTVRVSFPISKLDSILLRFIVLDHRVNPQERNHLLVYC